jgi:hypothetical protein
VVDPSASDQGHEDDEEGGSGKRKREEEVNGQGPSEEERDATLKFVVDELKSELFIELLEGFHK